MRRILLALCLLLCVGSAEARHPRGGAAPSGGGGALAITTSSLPGAAVGTAFSTTLAASGGSGTGYTYSRVSCAPCTDVWNFVAPNGALLGTPSTNETESVVYQVTDSAGATAQATFTIPVAVSGTLTIVSPTSLGTCANNGLCVGRLLATGGVPPYKWSSAALGPINNSCAMPWDGWVYCSPLATGTITIPVTVTDGDGATASQTETFTVNSTLTMGGIDPIDSVVHLPDANAGSLYRAPLLAWGGTGPYTFSCLSSCPGWMTVSGGFITGTPTVSGAVEPVLKVTDSASATATATGLINVNNSCQVTRPAGNTGTGFFVKAGLIYDPNGFCFLPLGEDQTHFDSTPYGSGGNAALTGININRLFLFSESAASSVSNITDMLNHNVVPMMTMSIWPTTGSCAGGGTNASGSSTACFAEGLKWWVAAESTYATYQDKIWINIANEWSGAWATLYPAVINTVASTSANTITLSSSVVGSTNPYASVPFAYLNGSCGATAAVMNITGTGGSSGAWTVTGDVSWGTHTTGCTLWGGAVGVMRGAGYTEPLVIDAGGGQDAPEIINSAATVQASDPQQNSIFSLHIYGAISDNAVYPICNFSFGGSPTTVTLCSHLPFHPFLPIYPNVTNSTFVNGQGYRIFGATGSAAALNGSWASPTNVFGTTPGGWQLHLTVSSSGLSCGGGGCGWIEADASGIGISSPTYYDLLFSRMAALRASNVASIIGEYQVSGNDLGGPLVAFNGSGSGTTVTVANLIAGSAPILTLNGHGGFDSGMPFDDHLGNPQCNLLTQTGGTPGGAGTYTVSNSSCAIASGNYFVLGWGPSPGNTLASQVAASGLANQIGFIPWSWDDHSQGDGSSTFFFDFGMTPQQPVSNCSAGAGCWTGLPSQLTLSGVDAILNPRYGILQRAQRAPYLH